VYVVLAIDLMTGGDLSADLLSRGTAAADIALPEDDARHIFRQILNGVNYMHQQRVVHRDLKLENILLCGTSARLVKISDFGMATICKSSTMLSDKNGTLLYMAPEVRYLYPLARTCHRLLLLISTNASNIFPAPSYVQRFWNSTPSPAPRSTCGRSGTSSSRSSAGACRSCPWRRWRRP